MQKTKKVANQWSCEIRKAHNGFILEYEEENENDFIKTEEELFENTEDKFDERINGSWDGDRIAFAKLVYGLSDYFGIEYGKWSEDNLRICFDKKGHGL